MQSKIVHEGDLRLLYQRHRLFRLFDFHEPSNYRFTGSHFDGEQKQVWYTRSPLVIFREMTI